MARIAARVVRANLRAHPVPAVILFVVVCAATGMLTLSVTVQRAAATDFRARYPEGAGMDLMVTAGARDHLPDLRGIAGVAAATRPYRTSVGLTISGGERADEMLLSSREPTDQAGRPVLRSGRWIRRDGEIVVEETWARRAGVREGDRVGVLVGPRPLGTVDVVGIGYDPLSVPWPLGPVNAYVMPGTFTLLASSSPMGSLWSVGARLDDPMQAEVATARVRSALGDGTRASVRTWIDTERAVREALRLPQILISVFAVFAIVIAALVLANVSAGIALGSYREIGVLKAAGFGSLGVAAVFVAMPLVVGAAAAVAGVGVGVATAPFVTSTAADALAATNISVADPWLLAAVVGAILLVIAPSATHPAIRAARVPAMQAIQYGDGGSATRASLAARFAKRLRLSPVVATGVKDLGSRPARSALTVASLVIAIAAASFVVNFGVTLRAALEDPGTIGLEPYDLKVASFTPFSEADVDAARATQGVASVVSIARTDGVVGARRAGNVATTVRGISGDVGELRLPVVAGASRAGRGETLVSLHLADRLDLRVGDAIQVGIGSRLRAFTVAGVYRDADGAALTMPLAGFRLLSAEPVREIGVALTEGGSIDAVEAALIGPPMAYPMRGTRHVTRITERVADALMPAGAIMSTMSVMLLAFAALSTLATMWLSVRERTRDLALLRTAGMTPRQVRRAVASGACALSVAAVAAGVPLGTIGARALVDLIGREVGVGAGMGAFAPVALLVVALVPLGIAVAVVGAWIPGRRAAAMSLTDALAFE